MNTRLSFHSKTFPESQRDILGMIATDHHLGDILCAICQMLDDRAPESFCSILLTDAEGKRLLSGAAPSLPVEYVTRFMEWPLVHTKEPAAPQRSGAS